MRAGSSRGQKPGHDGPRGSYWCACASCRAATVSSSGSSRLCPSPPWGSDGPGWTWSAFGGKISYSLIHGFCSSLLTNLLQLLLLQRLRLVAQVLKLVLLLQLLLLPLDLCRRSASVRSAFGYTEEEGTTREHLAHPLQPARGGRASTRSRSWTAGWGLEAALRGTWPTGWLRFLPRVCWRLRTEEDRRSEDRDGNLREDRGNPAHLVCRSEASCRCWFQLLSKTERNDESWLLSELQVQQGPAGTSRWLTWSVEVLQAGADPASSMKLQRRSSRRTAVTLRPALLHLQHQQNLKKTSPSWWLVV